VDGGVEVSVETEDVEFLVVLVLVGALIGDLDNGVDDLGTVRPDGELKIVRHKIGFLFSIGKNFVVAGGCR
jgi:hypothetical protein